MKDLLFVLAEKMYFNIQGNYLHITDKHVSCFCFTHNIQHDLISLLTVALFKWIQVFHHHKEPSESIFSKTVTCIPDCKLQFSFSRHLCTSSVYCTRTCKNFWFLPPIKSALTCSKHWTWYIHTSICKICTWTLSV